MKSSPAARLYSSSVGVMPLTSLTEDEIALKETGEGDDGRFAHIFFIFNSFLAFMSERWENDDELPNCATC